jgi:galactoside 2-L-fucosyltransferase 1/2
VYIAVHIRRTDLLKFVGQDYGVDYLNRSVNHMIQRFHDRCLLFIVCSDDMQWVTTNFRSVLSNSAVSTGSCKPEVEFFTGRNVSQDVAVLISCNHTIVTMGSFGWWIAYLANGHTVYFSKYPPFVNPTSNKPLMTIDSDVNLPSWVGLP